MINEYAWEYTTMHEAHKYWREIMQLSYNSVGLAQEIMSKFDLYVGKHGAG